MGIPFHRDARCYCKQTPCICAPWEAALSAQGLASLDLVHKNPNLPFVTVTDKGSGKLRTTERAQKRTDAEAEFDTRRAILTNHRFRNARQKRIWKLYADGLSIREIAVKVRRKKSAVGETLQAVRDDYAKLGEPTGAQLAALVHACDPQTLVLFFALIRRALEAPEEMRGFLDKADQSPALRALIDPEQPTNPDVYYDEHTDDETN